jgi:nicotinamidase-related amidase
VLDGYPTYDRTSINSWEDVKFREAIKATGRNKLIMTALWTEACLTYPALDARRRHRAKRGSGKQLREAILDAATELLLRARNEKAVSIRSTKP